MSAFSIVFEAGHSQGAHGGIDRHLRDFCILEKSAEPPLGVARRKIQTTAQHNAGLETDEGRRYPPFSGFDRIEKEIPIRFVGEDGDEN